nr:CHAT domain-containing protein [Acanthopleuribacter pedis]
MLDWSHRRNTCYELQITYQTVHPRNWQAEVTFDFKALTSVAHDPEAYGLALARMLWGSELADAWALVRGDDQPFRLTCAPCDDELQALHWHWLRLPRGAVSRSPSVPRQATLTTWPFSALDERIAYAVRLPTNQPPPKKQLAKSDLHLALVAAVPGAGSSDALAALLPEEHPYPVTVLDSRAADAEALPSLENLARVLSQEKPTVLHLTAHGRVKAKTGETQLELVGPDGQPERVSDQAFIDILAVCPERPHLIVLAACHGADARAPSATPSNATPFQGLATRLVKELGIPWVIAAKGPLDMVLAERLFSRFYPALFQSGDIPTAFAKLFAGAGDVEDRLAPVVLCRTHEPLFRDDPRRLGRAAWRRGLERLMPALEGRIPEKKRNQWVTRIKEHLAQNLEGDPNPEDAFFVAVSAFYQRVFGADFRAMARGEAIPPDSFTGNPFTGLAAFDDTNANAFFGRAQEVLELCRVLESLGVLLVHGDSGSGKSSLLQAGLLPELRKRYPDLSILRIRPNEYYEIPTGAHATIIVDHLEQLWGHPGSNEAADVWLKDLLRQSNTQEGQRCWVIGMVRQNDVGRLLGLDIEQNRIKNALHLLKPLQGKALLQAVCAQAGTAGLLLEDRLKDALEREMEDAACMPHVQLLGARLVERREGLWLTFEAYEQLGRLANIIGNEAERVFSTMTRQEQEICGFILSRLVQIASFENERPKQFLLHHATLPELCPDQVKNETVVVLVDNLVNARLLVCSAHGLIALGHEAMVRHWPRLQMMLYDFAECAKQCRLLQPRVQVWLEEDKNEAFLQIGDHELSSIDDLVAKHHFAITGNERDFIEAGRRRLEKEAKEKKEQQASISRLNRYLIVAFLILFFGFGAYFQKAEQEHLVRSRKLARDAHIAADKGDYQDSLRAALDAAELETHFLFTPTVPEVDVALFRALAGHRPFVTLTQHDEPVRGVAAAGDWVASWGKKTLRLTHIDGERAHVVTAHKSRFHEHVLFSPSGDRLLVVSNRGEAVVYQSDAVQRAFTLGDGGAKLVAAVFSQDGEQIVTADKKGRLARWHGRTGALLQETEHQGRFDQIALHPREPLVLFSDMGAGLYLWRPDEAVVATLRSARSGKNGKSLRHIEWDPVGRNALFLDGRNRLFRQAVWPRLSKQPVKMEDAVSLFRVDPGRQQTAVLGMDYRLSVFDGETRNLSTKATTLPARGEAATRGIAANDGTFTDRGLSWAALYRNRPVMIWHIDSGLPVFQTPPSMQPRHFAVADGAVIVADVANRVHRFPRGSIAFSIPEAEAADAPLRLVLGQASLAEHEAVPAEQGHLVGGLRFFREGKKGSGLPEQWRSVFTRNKAGAILPEARVFLGLNDRAALVTVPGTSACAQLWFAHRERQNPRTMFDLPPARYRFARGSDARLHVLHPHGLTYVVTPQTRDRLVEAAAGRLGGPLGVVAGAQ